MDLFTPSPKPRKRPAPVADPGRRTKAKTPQSTRSGSLASNSRPLTSREPADSTRRKPQNAKAGPSKLGKQSDAASTLPTRQSTRVSRPTLKKAAATDIVLSNDEDSDLPSPSTIFKNVPKTPPKPKKRKRASPPFTTQKISKVICLEISDSDDDEHAKARPMKRPKIAKNTAAPEDVINLCSSSEVEGPPPSSPLVQTKKRKISSAMDTQNAEASNTEVRKSKNPSRERDDRTSKVADIQSEVDPPHHVSHSPALLSPAPSLVPPPVSLPPPQRPVPLPTRIRSMRLVRTKSMLSGRRLTRPERESEITYFEPDAQPQLTLLTPGFFKKSIASVKAKIEVQKRKKKKAAATSAFASTSASGPAARLDAQVAPKTLVPIPAAKVPLPESSDLPQLDDTVAVSVEQIAPETAPLPEPIGSIPIPTMSEENPDTEATTENSLSEPIESILTTSNEVSEPDAGLITLREIPEFNDLVASAKHVTTVLDKLKALRRRGGSSSPSKEFSYRSSQPLPVNTQPNSSAVDEVKTATSSSPPKPAEDPPTLAKDTLIEAPLLLQPPSTTPASLKSPLLSSIVPTDQVDSNNSRKPSTSPEASGPPDSPSPPPTTTSEIVINMDALQHQPPPDAPNSQIDDEAVVTSTTKLDSVFPALGLDLAALACLPEIEGDAADYDDISLSDLELVYPEDLV